MLCFPQIQMRLKRQAHNNPRLRGRTKAHGNIYAVRIERIFRRMLVKGKVRSLLKPKHIPAGSENIVSMVLTLLPDESINLLEQVCRGVSRHSPYALHSHLGINVQRSTPTARTEHNRSRRRCRR